MSGRSPEAALLVRLADRPGSLERLLGQLRRKALHTSRLSILPAADGAQEVIIRFDPQRTSPDRLTAEVQALIDVRELTRLSADVPGTRELVLAHIQPRDTEPLPRLGRVLGRSRSGVVVELTGSPEDIEAALARLRAHARILRITRSGEMPVPRLTHTAHGGTET